MMFDEFVTSLSDHEAKLLFHYIAHLNANNRDFILNDNTDDDITDNTSDYHVLLLTREKYISLPSAEAYITSIREGIHSKSIAEKLEYVTRRIYRLQWNATVQNTEVIIFGMADQASIDNHSVKILYDFMFRIDCLDNAEQVFSSLNDLYVNHDTPDFNMPSKVPTDSFIVPHDYFVHIPHDKSHIYTSVNIINDPIEHNPNFDMKTFVESLSDRECRHLNDYTDGINSDNETFRSRKLAHHFRGVTYNYDFKAREVLLNKLEFIPADAERYIQRIRDLTLNLTDEEKYLRAARTMYTLIWMLNVTAGVNPKFQHLSFLMGEELKYHADNFVEYTDDHKHMNTMASKFGDNFKFHHVWDLSDDEEHAQTSNERMINELTTSYLTREDLDHDIGTN